MPGEPSCFAEKFEKDDPVCTKECFISKRCREVMEMRKRNAPPPPMDEPFVPEPVPDLQEEKPFEYLMSYLAAKFERSDSVNEMARGTWFKKEGKTVVQIVVSKKTGRISIKGETFERILDSEDVLKSIDDAEEVMDHLLQDIE